MGDYKDLKVWQLNQECIHQTLLLMEEVPQRYGIGHICKQLFRSISSIGANLAEGNDSYEGKEYVRYIGIAIRSAIESDHWLATLKNVLGERENLERLIAQNYEVVRMLKGLRKSIEAKRDNTP